VPYRHDMTMMLAIHAALRRELIRLRRIAERPGDDPRHILKAAVGWQLFTSFLHVHHGVEDDLLWPALRLALPADGDGLALLDAMEAEHARIDPLLAAIDQAVATADGGTAPLAELIATLTTFLLNHIDHEEHEGLPLIDATVSEPVWAAFSAEHAQRLGPDVSRFFPWTFDGAQPAALAAALAHLPPPVQQAYQAEWEPAYTQLTIWPRTAIDPWGADPAGAPSTAV
jgi:hemerythrin-like domain-containing protein